MLKLNIHFTRKAFTRFEVVVIVAVLAIVGTLLLAKHHKDQDRFFRSSCIGRLRQIGLSFRQWAIDHDGSFQMSVSTNLGGSMEYNSTRDVFRHFLVMSNDLNTPKILTCPSDTRPVSTMFPHVYNTNLSYFIGLDTVEEFPSMILTGDRNLTNGPLNPIGTLELKSNTIVGWTDEMHRRVINVGLSDGSVRSFDTVERLRESVTETGPLTNRLAFPLD